MHEYKLLVDLRIDGSLSSDADINTVSPGSHNESNIELNDNPLDQYRCVANETGLVYALFKKEFVSISPGENSTAESLIGDIFCEEVSHSHLFPT